MNSPQIEQYLQLLLKWNKAYNLTAIRDLDSMRIKHIADSLAVAPYLHGDVILDVGTGAGLPGMPLAITNPDKQFILLDSNGKKVRFLRQAIQELGLKNVQAVHARIEEYQADQPISSIISRAFASIYDMLSVTAHLANQDTQFLAMKGIVPHEELTQLPKGFKLIAIHELKIPKLDEPRCLIVMEKDVHQNSSNS
jgi:16S rRNA (guanine527-N7)-methyltransferase